MKKNVLLLVLDSLTADEFDDERYGETAMPFLHKLMERSTVADQFFSEGPHTEAGLHGIICGTNTLDYNGYLQRFSCNPRIIFDYFDEAGYDLHNMSWAGNFFPKRFEGKIKNYYTDGIEFPVMLFWRIGYYHELYQKGGLNEQDMNDLIDAYQDDFRICINFCEKKEKYRHAYDLVNERVRGFDLDGYASILREEYQKFIYDPKAYVLEDIKSGKHRKILQERGITGGNETDYDKLKRIEKRNARFLRSLKAKQIVSNLIDPGVQYGTLLKHLICWMCRKPHLYLGHYYTRLNMAKQFTISNMDRKGMDAVSLKTQFHFMAERLAECNREGRPFFFYAHPLSIHEPVEWFSFDADEYTVQQEINQAKKLIQKTRHYHGSYLYRLGMHYIDNCLQMLFSRLKENGLLDHTVVMITADHGTSLCSAPVRDGAYHNNCHSELYHIPMIIFEKGRKPEKIVGKWENRDIIPTLLDLCGINGDGFLQGQSMLHPQQIRKIAHSERTVSGAPALQHRDVIYAAWNDKYKIEYTVKLWDSFEEGRMTEAYDLIRDPLEKHNIVKKVKKEQIADLLQYLEKRHHNLRQNYMEFVKQRFYD